MENGNTLDIVVSGELGDITAERVLDGLFLYSKPGTYSHTNRLRNPWLSLQCHASVTANLLNLPNDREGAVLLLNNRTPYFMDVNQIERAIRDLTDVKNFLCSSSVIKYGLIAGGVATSLLVIPMACMYIVPGILGIVGFTTGGIAAGSIASQIHSLIGSGNVSPGSVQLFALLQRIGSSGTLSVKNTIALLRASHIVAEEISDKICTNKWIKRISYLSLLCSMCYKTAVKYLWPIKHHSKPKNKQYSESDHDALGKACNDEDGDDGGLH